MKKLFVLVSFMVAASMLLAGCGAATPTATMPEPATAAPAMPAATAMPAPTTAPAAAAPDPALVAVERGVRRGRHPGPRPGTARVRARFPAAQACH